MKSNGHGVRDFIIENFLYGDGAALQEDTSFLGSSIIDSTGILELVTFLEERYGIVVNDDEIVPANLDSLNNIAIYLNRKINGLAGGEPVVLTDPQQTGAASPLAITEKGAIGNEQKQLPC